MSYVPQITVCPDQPRPIRIRAVSNLSNGERKPRRENPQALVKGKGVGPWGVPVLLICVQILVRLDCFSHSIAMEVWKPARWKTVKIHRNKHTPERPNPACLFLLFVSVIWTGQREQGNLDWLSILTN